MRAASTPAPPPRRNTKARRCVSATAAPRRRPRRPRPTATAATSWTYEGRHRPAGLGKLKPEFNCARWASASRPLPSRRRHPAGPAEPLQFAYNPSNASVVNNGHTIQVDVQGDNQLTVRGVRYRLLQFHFHPVEEQVNGKRYPLVAHLVHQSAEGQLAVVAVLLDEGAANAVIDKVWTYMPLDAGDRVRMPAGC